MTKLEKIMPHRLRSKGKIDCIITMISFIIFPKFYVSREFEIGYYLKIMTKGSI